MKYTGRELTHKMCNRCINNSKQWTLEEAMSMHIPNASSESVVSCLEAQLYTEVASWDKNGCPSVHIYIYSLPLVSVLVHTLQTSLSTE